MSVLHLQARMGGDPVLGEAVLPLRALPADGSPLRVSALLAKDGRRCGKVGPIWSPLSSFPLGCAADSRVRGRWRRSCE